MFSNFKFNFKLHLILKIETADKMGGSGATPDMTWQFAESALFLFYVIVLIAWRERWSLS